MRVGVFDNGNVNWCMLGRAFLCRTGHFCVEPGFFCVEPCILLSNRAFLCRTSVMNTQNKACYEFQFDVNTQIHTKWTYLFRWLVNGLVIICFAIYKNFSLMSVKFACTYRMLSSGHIYQIEAFCTHIALLHMRFLPLHNPIRCIYNKELTNSAQCSNGVIPNIRLQFRHTWGKICMQTKQVE